MRKSFSLIAAISISVFFSLATTGSPAPVGAPFIYQGRLGDDAKPATGNYEFRFTLYDDASTGLIAGGPLTNTPVSVSNGLFTTRLDFGLTVFDGAARWLEIAVRTNGSTDDFIKLTPRQPITATPYALYATNAGGAGVASVANSVAAGAITGAGIQDATITADKIANGAVVKSINGLPDNVTFAAGAGLTLSGTIFAVAEGGIQSAHLADGVVTSNKLSTAGVSPGQILKYDGTQWSFASDNNTSYSAGLGLSLSGTQFNVSFAGNGSAGSAAHSDHTHEGVYAPLIHSHGAEDIVAGTLSDARLSANVALLYGNQTYTGIVAFSPSSGPPFIVGNLNKVENLNADLLDGLDSSAFWQLGGNEGTAAGAQFLGTTDNQPFEVKVNNARVLRLEPNDVSPNFVGGHLANFVSSGIAGATIGGGGSNGAVNSVGANFATVSGGAGNSAYGASATVSGGAANLAAGPFATVSGGQENRASSFSAVGGGLKNVSFGDFSTVGGGQANSNFTQNGTIAGGAQNLLLSTYTGGAIGGGQRNSGIGWFPTIAGGSDNKVFADYACVGGGGNNIIETNAYYGGIGSGWQNVIQTNANSSTIGGGYINVVEANAYGSTIAGGSQNRIRSGAVYATIPGGSVNVAAGPYSLAAGQRAQALHAGAFVWGDSTSPTTGPPITSAGADSVTMRASGGYRLFSNPSATVGALLAPGAGGWSSTSDRNSKENLEQVKTDEILEKVCSLPITTWNFKTQDRATRHIGPMAQDFHAAFGVGENNTTITTIDADGVALAAIQGLNKKVELQSRRFEEQLRAKDAEIRDLKQTISDLLRAVLECRGNTSQLP